MSETFFQVSKEQSRIKATIVAKYFGAWAKVIFKTASQYGTGKIGYFDFFAGPGRYSDGTESTPLAVLQIAISDAKLASSLVASFNDKDEANARSLEKNIRELPGIETLTHRPRVFASEIGDETAEVFERMRTIPTLFFIDPWGYKGLSLKLVNTVIKDWACECIFFFNYNRINMGLSNDIVRNHMDALFGQSAAEKLRARLDSLPSTERESATVEALCQALGGFSKQRFVLPFRFRDERGSRTSHYLIHVTKNFLGYEIMKEIMAKASSDTDEGVASFEYSPARQQDLFLFGFTRPIERLGKDLLERYAGRSLSVKALYLDHSVGSPFIISNYRVVIKRLAADGAVRVDRPSGKRIRKNTLPDDVVVTFPRIETV